MKKRIDIQIEVDEPISIKKVISSAFETLSHCMETYLNKPSHSNLTDEINEAFMRNMIRNMRVIRRNPDDENARNELKQASAIGESGLLELDKVKNYQCHMIEHHLIAFTNCNHGQALAAIQPALYHYLAPYNLVKFVRFAEEVWCVEMFDKTDEQIASDGIDALTDFIYQMGLPTSLSDIGITDDDLLHQIADASSVTQCYCKQFTSNEIYHILKCSK